MKINLLFLLWIILLSTHAQIATDGSLGQAINLAGPDYQIGADLGQLRGGNLFHSFQDFNLQRFESATFSGPNHIQNVISRVTGGNPSYIDGLFRSTIPDADMYFLNPYGIMFGPNARLDVQGSFHASTADYLRLGENGRFDARNPNESLLTVAPVKSFGFLTNTQASITLQDSMLTVAPTKTLSLIGGELNLNSQIPVQFDEGNSYATFARSLLNAPNGQINLVALDSVGEVVLQNRIPLLLAQGGNINLINIMLEVSGLGAGAIFIRGHDLSLQDSVLQALTFGELDGFGTDIRLSGDFHITSQFPLFNSLVNKNFGTGHGGNVFIQAVNLTLDSLHIRTDTFFDGNAGNIDVEVEQLTILNGSEISANSFGKGKGGYINIHATDSILLSGYQPGIHKLDGVDQSDLNSGIVTITLSQEENSLGSADITINTKQLDLVGGDINAGSFGKGNAGNISIQAENLNITKGGYITASSLNSGIAGDIEINLTHKLFISGRDDKTLVIDKENIGDIFLSEDVIQNGQSSIFSVTANGLGGQINIKAQDILLTNEAIITSSVLGFGEGTSHINIQADTLSLTKGGKINNSNGVYAGNTFISGNGKGSDINIHVKQLMLDGEGNQQTGVFTDTYNQYPGGNIFIQTDNLNLNQHAVISARSFNTGDAGQIEIQSQTTSLHTNGAISTTANNAGGGNITLQADQLLYLNQGLMSTSVKTGHSDGGNIDIANPQFTVLNKGIITAQADAGHGGNIRIVAEQFIASPDSLVSASSRLGLDGDVEIDSPNKNITEGMLTLSSEMIDASRMIKKSCDAMTYQERENQGQFIVHPLAGNPASPYDLQPSPPLKTTTTKQPQQTSPKTITHQAHSMIAATCKPSPVQPKTPVKKQEHLISEQLF